MREDIVGRRNNEVLGIKSWYLKLLVWLLLRLDIRDQLKIYNKLWTKWGSW